MQAIEKISPMPKERSKSAPVQSSSVTFGEEGTFSPSRDRQGAHHSEI
jgi:hypothetical protein